MRALHILKSEKKPDVDKILVEEEEQFLKRCLKKLYDFQSDKIEKSKIANIAELTKMPGGICAVNLEPGDVAWCCMDCEKDPTAIICKNCFEKSDHKGHRVVINRNVSGCCDCGDPEAWDSKHFCTEHIGYEKSPEEILKKFPGNIRESAFSVFQTVCAKIRKYCLDLIRIQEVIKNERCVTVDDFQSEIDKSEDLKTKIEQVFLLLKFLNQRVVEVPAFLYIIDQKINEVGHDQKPQNHKCCLRGLVGPESSEKLKNDEEKCTCSLLDILMQTINTVDEKCRKKVHDLALKLFQSYNFKQQLILSYAANFGAIHQDRNFGDEQYHITSLSVQVLTSSELAMLLYKNETLLNHMLAVFNQKMEEYVTASSSDHLEDKLYRDLNYIIHDLDYIGRKDCLNYCIEHTSLIPQLIKTISRLYTFDSKKQRTTMVENAEHGTFHEGLVRMELSLISVLNIYLTEVKHDDLKSNKEILGAFIEVFKSTFNQIPKENGIYCLPIHRCFAYYFVRLILYNYYDSEQFTEEKTSKMSVQQVFRAIALANLPLNSDLNEILKNILKLQIQQTSFVHEISCKKWIYLGDYLQQYPDIYHKAQDLIYFQDFSNFQMILSMSEGSELIDYFISNFGLDGEFQVLIKGLKDGKVVKSLFDGFEKFDEQKLRMQLTLFLRFITQLCVYEITFLKQIYNPIEEGEPDSNTPEVISMWKHALRKEAVHLLMLNKVNVNIQTLKESMIEILEEDQMFEDTLFEVTEQSRDIKNQVTFKLKEEHHGVFDPFYYVVPEQHSQVYQMYDQNNFKNQSVQKGLNDMVGDYMGHSSFVSDVNQALIENVEQSNILDIVFPLFENWLFRKEDSSLQEKEFLDHFVDQSVFSACLKIIILVINSKKTEKLAQKLNSETISRIHQWKEEQNLDVKTKNILLFVLRKFKQIRPEFFENLQIDEDVEIEPPKQKESQKTTPDDKIKSKLKKRQEKLLEKMKKGGSKYLVQNKKTDEEDLKDEDSVQCAFCQENLENEKFIENPFGNFIYCQSNNLLYHSMKKSLEIESEIIPQIEQKIEVPEKEEEEKKQSEIPNEIAEENDQEMAIHEDEVIRKQNAVIEAKSKIHQLETVKTICDLKENPSDFDSFLNNYTGSGSVITSCKHHAHLECLRKYHLQQVGLGDDDEQRKVNAFSYGEFACPICKQIKNGILPSFSLGQIQKEFVQFQELNKDEVNKLLDFYVDVFSQLIQSQVGLTIETEVQTLVLKDFLFKPALIIQGVMNHFMHVISMTQIKGIQDYVDNDVAPMLKNLYQSLVSIVQIVAEKEQLCPFNESMLARELTERNLLEQNLCVMAMKHLLLGSIGCTQIEEHIEKVLETFYPLLEIQFLNALFYWQGKDSPEATILKFQKLQDIKNYKEGISEQQKNKLLQIEIQEMRKIFLTVNLLRQVFSFDEKHDKETQSLKRVSKQESDEEQLKIIKEYLGLEKESQLQNEEFVETQIQFSENSKERPDILKLLSEPILDFKFFDLPSTFLDLQQIYYKKQCTYCSKEPKDCAICLLCGQTMCYVDDSMDQYCIVFDFENLLDSGEGVLSYHTRVKEGRCGVFLHLSTGNIIMIQNGSSAQSDSPYRNKYGEVVNPRDKRWNSFKIDKQGGGIDALQALKKLYMDFKVASTILSIRNNPDSPFDIFEKNDL